MIVPDVNVLIYAFRADQPDHGRYREWLIGALTADEPVALPGPVLSGFMRVVTNPRVFTCATPPAEAARSIEVLRAAVTRRFPRSPATWEPGRGRIRDVSTGASVRADLSG